MPELRATEGFLLLKSLASFWDWRFSDRAPSELSAPGPESLLELNTVKRSLQNEMLPL
jgi:hypothetical protein